MDKDLLYRFFEGRASVEEMRLVKEWSEASEENSKLLRRERKLFNAIILSGRLEPSDGQTTLRKKRNHFVREFLKILKSASNLNGNLNCSKELEHYAS